MTGGYARALRERKTSGELDEVVDPIVRSTYILYLEECTWIKPWPRAKILDRATKLLETPMGRKDIEDHLNDMSTSVPGTPYLARSPSPTSPTPSLSLGLPVSDYQSLVPVPNGKNQYHCAPT